LQAYGEELQKLSWPQKEDLLHNPEDLKKAIDMKLIAYLRVLPFHGSNAACHLTSSLNRAICLNSPAAAMGLLRTVSNPSSHLTPTQIEMLYEEIPLAIQDLMVCREMVMRLTWCLREHGKLLALKFAAGKLDDATLLMWLLKSFPTWEPVKLRDWGLVTAIRFGNLAATQTLLSGR
jgi:hypothetical protein